MCPEEIASPALWSQIATPELWAVFFGLDKTAFRTRIAGIPSRSQKENHEDEIILRHPYHEPGRDELSGGGHHYAGRTKV
jgi:hypothetical protein